MTGWAEWLLERGTADAGMVAEAERVLEAAALRPGDTVLDVGSGLGLLTLAASERIGDGWVIAIDPSVAALEELLRLAHAANANGIMYLVGDAEVLPLPDASVDAAVLGSVLLHVGDPGAVVDELARVIRPDGRLSLREPLDGGATTISTAVDWSSLGELGARVVSLRETSDADPLPPLDVDSLTARLSQAGFTDVEAIVEDLGETWLVTEASLDARLDETGGPATESVRERWQRSFTPPEVETLVSHLRSLAGTTIAFRAPQLFLSARRS
jgi:ubiquinone/menaquinone biosynthesis C-methylase UbiE